MFETLDPPAGGLSHLRERMARDAQRRRQLRQIPRLALVAAPMVLVAWIVFATRAAPDIPPELDLVRMQLGQLAVPSDVVTLPDDPRRQIAVRRVPLPTNRVVFYRVGSIQE